MNREFLMLAQVFDPAKHDVSGWYVSEKLDGQRCFWDGGVSRGKPTREVPWANLDKTVKPVASGLWSRYGNVITAPDWWLDDLPVGLFLDGELWCGSLQILRTIVSRHEPDENDWKKVQYLVFDSPGLSWFNSGTINNQNFKKDFDRGSVIDYFGKIPYDDKPAKMIFREPLTSGKYHRMLEQVLLPPTRNQAKETVYDMLEGVNAAGGEGLMLRHPFSMWTPKRVPTLLKVKPMLDAVGTVIGHLAGEGRLKGLLGSLKVKWGHVTFDLGTGFDDSERRAELYPLGSQVEFKYTSLTVDGVPREARYVRIREIE